MRIAKPLLLTLTPIGVIGGLYEAYQLAGGLVFLMAALVAFISAAFGMLVLTIRDEKRAEAQAEERKTPITPTSHPPNEEAARANPRSS